MALGADAVWVVDSEANTVTRVDSTGLLTPIPVGRGPSALAVGAGAVWVADLLDDAVVRIDPAARAVTTTIPVGRAPTGVAVGAGSVWVANSGDGTVTRIDPSGDTKPETIPVGGSRRALLWLGDRSGSRSLREPSRPQTGQLASAPSALARCTTSLNGYRVRVLGPILATPVPGVRGARALPESRPLRAPNSGPKLPRRCRANPRRKTYTFTIRNGFRFSSLERARNRTDVQVHHRAKLESDDERACTRLSARRRRCRCLHLRQGSAHHWCRRRRQPIGDPPKGTCAGHRHEARAYVLLRGSDWNPDRPQGSSHDPLRRPVLRRVTCSRARRRAETQPELPG